MNHPIESTRPATPTRRLGRAVAALAVCIAASSCATTAPREPDSLDRAVRCAGGDDTACSASRERDPYYDRRPADPRAYDLWDAYRYGSRDLEFWYGTPFPYGSPYPYGTPYPYGYATPYPPGYGRPDGYDPRLDARRPYWDPRWHRGPPGRAPADRPPTTDPGAGAPRPGGGPPPAGAPAPNLGAPPSTAPPPSIAPPDVVPPPRPGRRERDLDSR